MSPAYIHANERYAWHGQSLLITNAAGECGEEDSLTGYYFREARHLRTLRLEINGVRPWLCESATQGPEMLYFSYVHPELGEFGGGGSGYSKADISRDDRGIPHRALDIRIDHLVDIASLEVRATITNRVKAAVDVDVAWIVEADYADIEEALGNQRQQHGGVSAKTGPARIDFAYEHPQLPYGTSCIAGGDGAWRAEKGRLTTSVRLTSQQSLTLTLRVQPTGAGVPDAAELAAANELWSEWREKFASVAIAGNRIAETTVRNALRDLASMPLLQGRRDEWLTPQAGVPLYPALFARDAFTAGWQAGWVDGGRMLDASLTRLGRMQGDRVDPWRDEQPGRLPYQVRQGPLSLLNINPYSAYYADFASPMMFIISLAHTFAWTGDEALVERHWSTALRVLDWLNRDGDRDGDGYLEYLTVSPKGTKNQGWKDSGNAILYEDGTAVPDPLGTCELQGYWYASLQLMSAMSWMRGEKERAKELWHQAMELKARFNRDWWMKEKDFFALALDPRKQLVTAVTSNVGQCIATGIIDDEHLPTVVDRLFAPDLFSGWGIRTLSIEHPSYNPIDYHLGSVWAVENASIAFGLARFGFGDRVAELAEGIFALARLYPDYRIPETVGGYSREERPFPGAYPRTNTVQLWNASAFPMLLQSLLRLQPLAPAKLLVVDPHLPEWLPDVTIRGLRVGDAVATVRFWRDDDGDSHARILEKRGKLRLVRQPPIESLKDGMPQRFGALVDTLVHSVSSAQKLRWVAAAGAGVGLVAGVRAMRRRKNLKSGKPRKSGKL